ncbi:TrmB family transcriptional regulator [Halalkaliarchaeum desulfuricum]|uniref:TrmB family transcriptional regulator n=1 Tax=Halalkaliarchaeum desulfuricum TaxID=2055893 RepID=A0A343TNR3_9EURY|nr:TrmB family transcriptional regulator [Halalkaliarchaeum desulfuricum]AUX10735.1 TrmB family transcriptional regulator [Halalkaliarchaeum desulfuricum]
MDTADLRRALEEAGLSQYQADAYTALLRLGSASATEVADACDVPSARIYDVLGDLEERGYVETYDQERLRAQACNPDDVLEDLRNRADRLATAAEEIENRWEQPDLEEHRVSIVKRFDTVFDRATRLVSEAENEVQVAVTPDGYEELEPALRSAHESGALVKVSIHTGRGEGATALPDEERFDGAVTEIRHRQLPTPFLALVDRTVTCFSPHRESLNEYGVLVDDHTLSYVFHWYFRTCLWEVWPVVYDDRNIEPPISYTDIRRFVRECEPLLAEGAEITVRVEGYATETGRSMTVEGILRDLAYVGDSTGRDIPLSHLAGQVTVYLERTDGTDGSEHATEPGVGSLESVSVGGWGAVIEDIEARRLTVTAIEGDERESQREPSGRNSRPLDATGATK